MRLETYQGIRKDNPSWDEISNAINENLIKKNSFIILSESKFNFIQVTKSNQGGYMIERRDGRRSALYTSHRKDFSLEEVNEIFRHYFTGNSSWKSEIRWHFTTVNTIPRWARVASKIGMGFSVVFLIIFLILDYQLNKSNTNNIWIPISFMLMCYGITAGSIDELFTPRFPGFFQNRSPLNRRYFWISVYLSLLSTTWFVFELRK